MTTNFLCLASPLSAAPTIPPVPHAQTGTKLTDSAPVARLTARQSALGSLVLDGATSAWWELAGSQRTGFLDGGVRESHLPEFANRPILELFDGRLYLGAKHARELRRVLVRADRALTVTGVGGARITVVPAPHGETVLHVSVIGAELELRREVVRDGEDPGRAFGFR
ncbi:hypothetical protein [Rathayibacter rathayi]|uniref:hypothetical protein n=1 Tax=Rathayibacter rathayi TaxID=33887 RepID=UPI0011B0BA43|nr:hypothetical protein [Rathayibacter rathayi]